MTTWHCYAGDDGLPEGVGGEAEHQDHVLPGAPPNLPPCVGCALFASLPRLRLVCLLASALPCLPPCPAWLGCGELAVAAGGPAGGHTFASPPMLTCRCHEPVLLGVHRSRSPWAPPAPWRWLATSCTTTPTRPSSCSTGEGGFALLVRPRWQFRPCKLLPARAGTFRAVLAPIPSADFVLCFVLPAAMWYPMPA